MESPDSHIVELVRRALDEDSAANDSTTRSLALDCRGCATVTARSACVVSGHKAARCVFDLLDGSIGYRVISEDGTSLLPGERVAELEGPLGPILSGERTALNLLQHLSGVATLTSRFVAMVEGTRIGILDTPPLPVESNHIRGGKAADV